MKTNIDPEVMEFQFERFRNGSVKGITNSKISNWDDFFHVSQSIQNELESVRQRIKQMDK